MCVAIPSKIVEILDNEMLRVTVGNGPTELTVSGMLLPTKGEVGDFVIIHAGFAMHKMDRTEAEESLRLFREILEPTGESHNF